MITNMITQTPRTADYRLAVRAAQELSNDERVALAEYLLDDIDALREDSPAAVERLADLLNGRAPGAGQLAGDSNGQQSFWAHFMKAQELVAGLSFPLPDVMKPAVTAVTALLWEKDPAYAVAVHEQLWQADDGSMFPSGNVNVRFGCEGADLSDAAQEVGHVGIGSMGELLVVQRGSKPTEHPLDVGALYSEVQAAFDRVGVDDA